MAHAATVGGVPQHTVSEAAVQEVPHYEDSITYLPPSCAQCPSQPQRQVYFSSRQQVLLL